MQRRIEQAHDHRQAIHGLEHAVEVAGLSLEQLGDGLFANLLVLVKDEGLDDLLAVAQEHMLGAAQADALGAEVAGKLSVLGVVGVGAHTQGAEVVGPFQDGVQVAGELGEHQIDGTEHDDARGTVEGNHVAFLDDDVGAGDGGLLLLGVDLERLNAADARGAHAAGDNGGVRRLAAMGGEDALGGDHAGQVVGRGLPANQHALATGLGGGHGIGGGEHGLTHGSARGSVQTAREHVVFRVLVELRVQQLVELLGVDAHDGLFLGDEALALHIDGDVQRGGGGALADAGLQHEQLALLDGELDVHHVAEVILQKHEDVLELLTGFLQAVDVLELGDRGGVANAGDDVLALGVDQVVAVEFLLAVRRVARERNAGGGGVALVAEDHALHVDGGAQVVGNLILLAVDDRALVVPAAEHGLDGQAQLHHRVLREGDLAVDDERRILLAVDVLGEDALELADQLFEVVGRQVGVGLHAADVLHGGDGVLEQVAVKTHDDVGEHLDEATVGVPCEARVLRLLDQAVDGFVVQAEVQDRVHHARHGHGGAGTDGNQQRIFGVADLLADAALKILAVFVNGFERAFGPRVVGVGVLHARLAGNGEPGRHRQTDVGHLGQVGTLTAKHGLHVRVALGNVVALGVMAERVHTLDFCSHFFNSSPKSFMCPKRNASGLRYHISTRRVNSLVVPQNLLSGFLNGAIFGVNDNAAQFAHEFARLFQVLIDVFGVGVF